MTDQFALADASAQFILAGTPLRPKIGLVLGSGWARARIRLPMPLRVPYSEIPAFPRSTAIGHAGQMVLGKVGDVPVAAMQAACINIRIFGAGSYISIRVFGRMGIRAVILTNAAGGIDRGYSQGALV